MVVVVDTSAVIARPRAEVFAFCTQNETYEQYLKPMGPIAGVAKSVLPDGGPLRTGGIRDITLTDGLTLRETILDHSEPSRHEYQWVGGIKPPFAWLVRSGTGCWEFSEVSDGTRVDWQYSFELTSPLAYLPAMAVLGLFRRWMASGLNAIAQGMPK